jgi:hypothetical protein
LSTPSFDLIEHAKSKSRECLEELTEPDEDIMPLMMFQGPHGLGFMPLGDIMEDAATKDEGALWMTATLAVGRATEAVMITTAYMAHLEKDDARVHEDGGTITVEVPICEMPERTEHIVLMCSATEGNGTLVSAPVTRYPDKPPTLGEWETSPQPDKVGGRFGDAVNAGLRIAKEMPPEMAEIVDEGWKDGTSADLIQRFVNVARTFIGPVEPLRKMGLAVVDDPRNP